MLCKEKEEKEKILMSWVNCFGEEKEEKEK